MCHDEILLRSEFYLGFLRPLDVRYSIRAVLTADPEPLVGLSAGRPHRARPFGDAQRRILEAVTPHLIQAIRIQERLESVQAGGTPSPARFERMPLAVIFLDRRCRLVEMNSHGAQDRGMRATDCGSSAAFSWPTTTRAEVQLPTDDLRRRGRRLRPFPATRRRRLPAAPGGPPSARRRWSHRPASPGLFPASRSARVVVLIEQPERQAAAPFAGVHQRGYRLSPGRGRARVTDRRRDVATAGGRGDRHLPTTPRRTHLKRVFVKTGARRQSDLVRRVP